MDTWTSVDEKLPDFHEDLEVSYDGGKTFEDGITYLEKRTCMLAGFAGGCGYFGPGFATSGKYCDYGLIVDTPTHWRLESQGNEATPEHD